MFAIISFQTQTEFQIEINLGAAKVNARPTPRWGELGEQKGLDRFLKQKILLTHQHRRIWYLALLFCSGQCDQTSL
jgi:hypothetical protein